MFDIFQVAILILMVPYLIITDKHPEPRPEDFIVWSDSLDSPNSELEIQTEEDWEESRINRLKEAGVKIETNSVNNSQLIFHERDGYSLELPAYLKIDTGNLSASLNISDQRNPEASSSVDIFKKSGTVEEVFEESVKYHKEYAKDLLEILKHELIKINDPKVKVEAYLDYYVNDVFGDESDILIPDERGVFILSNANEHNRDLAMTILKGFKLIKHGF